MLGLSRFLSRTSYRLKTSSCQITSCRGENAFPGVRRKTTEAGNNKSGYINTGPNEGILYLDNVFPLRLNILLGLPFFNSDKFLPQTLKRLQTPSHSIADPITITERAIPKTVPIHVQEVLPRLREGGAFVKFSHEPQIGASEIEKSLHKYLNEHPINPWFNPFGRVNIFLVLGKPWVEDLYRFPSVRLKVEFLPSAPGKQTAELSQETLYSLFRKFGKLADIVPQAAESKEVPRYAYLTFTKSRHAIMAKNCLHGYTVSSVEGGGNSGITLKLGYVRKANSHWIRSWLMSHPRIVVPALLAVLATITVAVFDPLRIFFIKAYITHSFQLSDSKLYQWVRSQATKANDILTFRRYNTEDAGLKAIWDDRKDDIEQIRTWLMETADTFIVIQGPRGSGKRELVLDQALKDHKKTLVIDCKPIQDAKGDSATIVAAALEVGYRPVFSSMNTINSLLDLAAQGTIGTKTGFSETLDTQLDKIWQSTSTALRQIALDGRGTEGKGSELGEDEYLEAHPECRPVVVIDNFLHRSQENPIVYDKISQWAATLTTTNIAHVIFLTNDVSFSKSLSKALPDRVFRQISLGDCSPEVAKRFVINHLDEEASDARNNEGKLLPSQTREDLNELDECIETLGGRLTDLGFLARRIKAGETPKKAIHEIIDQSASEILKLYILDVDRSDRAWTPEQAWLLIKSLAINSSLRYNELLLSDTYKSGGESTLQSLEQAELITIVSANGRPHSIKPGKPIYAAAFKQLTEDHVLKARLDLSILTEWSKMETAGIEKCEMELRQLAKLPGQPAEVQSRIKWLLGKINTGHEKISKYEHESNRLKKVLQQEF